MVAPAVMVGGAGAAASRSAKRSVNTVCNFSKETQLGAQEPLGFFDPAGFCEDARPSCDTFYRCLRVLDSYSEDIRRQPREAANVLNVS